MTQEELQKKLDEIDSQLQEANEKLAKAEERATTAEEKLAKAEETAQYEAARKEAVSKLSDDDRELVEKWSEERQAAFVKADEGERTKMIEESRDISKSMSEEVRKEFDTLKQRAEEAEKRQAEIEKRSAEQATEIRKQELIKKAEADYPNLPGTPEEKADILKSLDKLEQDEQEAVSKLFDAANAAFGDVMKQVGRDGGGQRGNSAEFEIDKKAKEMVVKSGGKMTIEQAWTEVCKLEPALYNRYNEEQQ